MNDRELEQMLQARLRAQADGAGTAPAALYASVAGIPDTIQYEAFRYPSRRFLLLAAALLVALVVGGAFAVGSGLIRLPTLPEEPLDQLSTVVLHPIPCDLTLDEGVALRVEYQDPDRPASQLVIGPDGRMILVPQYPGTESGESWEQRRMSSEGVSQLLAAVETVGLRDCADVPIEGPASVSARIGNEVVRMGFGGTWTRIPSPEELDAAQVLADRLNDPDLGVPVSEWIARDWQPFVPDRWEIRLHRWEGRSPPGVHMFIGIHLVPWAEMTLPDGSTFRSVGSSVPNELGDAYSESRCHVISTPDLELWREAFASPLEGTENDWVLQDGYEAGGVRISMRPLLPYDPECAGPPAPAPRENLIDDLQVCALLPAASGWGNGSEIADFGGGWASCEYLGGGWVVASRHPVSTTEAPAVVANQFGSGFTVGEVDGHTVYLNACLEPDVACRAAIAISAEPYLVILVPDLEYSPEDLRENAGLVIESLPNTH